MSSDPVPGTVPDTVVTTENKADTALPCPQGNGSHKEDVGKKTGSGNAQWEVLDGVHQDLGNLRGGPSNPRWGGGIGDGCPGSLEVSCRGLAGGTACAQTQQCKDWSTFSLLGGWGGRGRQQGPCSRHRPAETFKLRDDATRCPSPTLILAAQQGRAEEKETKSKHRGGWWVDGRQANESPRILARLSV